jgi:predicted acetyltransferase
VTTLPTDLQITVAAPGERPILANLLQFYIHDFSEYWSGTRQGEIEADGRFLDYPLDNYWSDPRRAPLLFRLNGRLAGFALLNDQAHTTADVDWNMAEFFVARKHRGAGLGRRAARTIFARFPGLWEVAVARRNVRALRFWEGVVASCPGVADLERSDQRTPAWNGPLFRFRVTAGPERTT